MSSKSRTGTDYTVCELALDIALKALLVLAFLKLQTNRPNASRDHALELLASLIGLNVIAALIRLFSLVA
jgi:hypothetical protein